MMHKILSSLRSEGVVLRFWHYAPKYSDAIRELESSNSLRTESSAVVI